MRGQIHALKLTRMTPSTIASVVLYRAGEITRDATRRLEGRALLPPTARSPRRWAPRNLAHAIRP